MNHAKYTIRLLQAAEEDFKEVITYIALDNPLAAEATANKIEKSLSNISHYPLIGKIPVERELTSMGYRFLIIQNYLVFYTVEEYNVWVHCIIHGARDYLGLL